MRVRFVSSLAKILLSIHSPKAQAHSRTRPAKEIFISGPITTRAHAYHAHVRPYSQRYDINWPDKIFLIRTGSCTNRASTSLTDTVITRSPGVSKRAYTAYARHRPDRSALPADLLSPTMDERHTESTM